MLRSALRASAATLGLAIFVDVPSKNQPHALKLKRADAAGATYRGVAANATQSSLRNFQLSLDAVFAPCDEATFEALKRAYSGWSASRSAVAWEAGRDFRLSDLLPPLAQALCGRRFTPTTSGDVLCNANCWGFAYSVLEAAAAPRDSVTVSAGAHGDAWAALVAVTDRVQSTLEQGHDLLGDQRNAALAPGDVLMLWHQNTGEEMYLDHVAILVDDVRARRRVVPSSSRENRADGATECDPRADAGPLPGKGGLGRRDAVPPHRLGRTGGVVAARRLRVGLAPQKAGNRRAAGARGLRLQVGTEGRARGRAIRRALRGHGAALVGQDPRRSTLPR